MLEASIIATTAFVVRFVFVYLPNFFPGFGNIEFGFINACIVLPAAALPWLLRKIPIVRWLIAVLYVSITVEDILEKYFYPSNDLKGGFEFMSAIADGLFSIGAIIAAPLLIFITWAVRERDKLERESSRSN
jgi:hypothetical protein